MKFLLETTELYNMWYFEQPLKIQLQIEARLLRIQSDGHFGTWRSLGDGLSELKFNNGNRIYFTIEKRGRRTVILILGGNKNGQSKDIAKAKNLLKI